MNDPKRLLEGQDGETPEQLQQLLASARDDVLAPARVVRVRANLVGLGTLGGAVASGGSKAAASIAWGKLTLGILAVGVLGVGGYALFAPHHAAPSSVPSALTAPSVGAVETAPLDLAPNVPAVPFTSATASSRSASRVRAPAPALSATAAVAASEPSPKEGLLLLQARRALETDPTLALTLLAEHEREFPNSQLAPERSKLRQQAEGRIQH